MPTLDDLLRETPPGAQPQAPEAAPVVPMNPKRGLDALLEYTAKNDPTLDTTLDGPPPIRKTNRIDAWLRSGQAIDPTLQLKYKIGSSIARTLGDVVQAPGKLAVAATEYFSGEKFEPSLEAPITSTFFQLNKLVDKLDENVLAPLPIASDPWYASIPEGVGSGMAFLGLGAAGQAAKFSPVLTSGAAGAAVGATNQIDEAQAMGADPESQLLAYAGGAAFGATEAVPGKLFLDKINKLSKGRVMEQIKLLGMNGDKTVLRETLEGAFTEMAQEGFQTVGGNWVARDLAAYDPSRTLGENFWKNVGTAGVTGSMFGGALGMLRKAEVKDQLDALERIRQAKLASGDPINFLEGSFSPVEDLVRLNKMNDDIQQELLLAGAMAEIDPTSPELPKEEQTPLSILAYSGSMSDQGAAAQAGRMFNDKKVDPVATKELVKNGEVPLIFDAISTSPVVAQEFTNYDKPLEVAKKTIEKIEALRAKIPEAQRTPNTTLDELKEKYLALLTKKKLAQKLLTDAKTLVASIREVYSPDTRIIISANQETRKSLKLSDENKGSVTAFTDWVLEDGMSSAVSLMTLNIDEIVTDIYNKSTNKTNINKALYDKARRDFFSTITHEMGHVILSEFISAKLIPTLKSTDSVARQNAAYHLNWLTKEYQTWLKTALSDNVGFMLDNAYSLSLGENIKTGFSAAGINIDPYRLSNARSWQDQYNNIADSRPAYLSFQEFFAEMTARLATQGTLGDEVMNRFFSPVVDQYKKLFDSFPQYAKNEYGGNWKKFLESQAISFSIKNEQEKIAAGGGKDIISALRHLVPGFNPENFAGLQSHLDKWNKGLSLGLNLIQMSKMFPHIPHWNTYLSAVTKWQAYQRNFAADAVDTLKSWRSLGKVDAALLAEILYEEGSTRKQKSLPEVAARLSAEGVQVYMQVREQLGRVLDEMRLASLEDATKSFSNKEQLAEEIVEINKEFDKMKASGYFPFIRFGKFTITVRANEDLEYNGEKYKKGKLISFPVFETAKERDLVLQLLKTELGSRATISSGIMRESEFAIQGMPRSLLRSLKKKLANAGGMSKEQEQALDQAIEETAPFRNFRKQFVKKKGIHGYSEDAIRSYAYYMRSAAGHISRVKFADEMRQGIEGMQDDVTILQASGQRSDDRQEMRHWMDRHFSYIMNPANEWAALRGVGFVAYLGFNIKSALVNFMQMPTVVYPYLAARYGDVASVNALTKASATLADWVKNKKKYLEAAQDANGKLSGVLSYAIRRGAVDGQEGAHFSTHGASTYFDDRDESVKYTYDTWEEADLGFYDLRGLKIANTQDPKIAKEIIKRAIEIGERNEDVELETIDQLNEMLEEENPFIDYIINEEAQLYRGAQSLGYDGMMLVESDDAPGSATTVYAFQKLDKVKKLSREQWQKNKETAIAGGPASRERRIAELIARGHHEGWLDQSLATEIAIAASEDNLDRGLYLPKGKAAWHKAAEWSAKPFHIVEKTNRYVTALAAYDLEFAKSKDHEKAVLAAREANWSANYENSRWNRPEFIRGKKSAALLFTNFIQNTLFFAVKDPGARRYYLMLLLLAGAMGLPGAEDVEDLVDFAATSLNRQLGISNPKFSLRHELRIMLEELSLNPDVILHGLAQNSFGLGHVGELTGIPIPQFDLSGSVGMGNILPLTEIPKKAMTADSGDLFLEAMGSAAGASGNLVEDYYRNLMSSSPDDWKKAEKLLPLIAMRNASKAARMAVRGGEQAADGRFIAEFDPYDMRDSLELIGQGLGFTPSKLKLGWERQMVMRDTVQYYKVQQEAVMRQHNWAFFQEDREAIADAREAIAKYNKQVPYPEMIINGDAIKRSLKSYFEKRIIAEMGETSERKYRRLQKKVEEPYPDPYGDSLRTDVNPQP